MQQYAKPRLRGIRLFAINLQGTTSIVTLFYVNLDLYLCDLQSSIRIDHEDM